jgi:hypothetical protein
MTFSNSYNELALSDLGPTITYTRRMWKEIRTKSLAMG